MMVQRVRAPTEVVGAQVDDGRTNRRLVLRVRRRIVRRPCVVLAVALFLGFAGGAARRAATSPRSPRTCASISASNSSAVGARTRFFRAARSATRVVRHEQVRRLVMAFDRLVDGLDRQGLQLLDLANRPVVVDGKQVAERLIERALDVGDAELLLRPTALIAGLSFLPARVLGRLPVADLVIVPALPVAAPCPLPSLPSPFFLDMGHLRLVIGKGAAGGDIDRLLAGVFLPAADGRIDVERVDLDASPDAAGALAGDQRRAAAEETGRARSPRGSSSRGSRRPAS